MSALHEILAEPCLIERVDGSVVIKPLRFIPVRHDSAFAIGSKTFVFGRARPVSVHPTKSVRVGV